jgi:hypothetical protein
MESIELTENEKIIKDFLKERLNSKHGLNFIDPFTGHSQRAQILTTNS